MSLEGISSKGSLRFDEFPTSMKATQSFSGSRATRLLAYENARLSESRCSPLLQGEPQGLRRLRFPFFISQCQRAGGRAAESHTPEPPMEANPPSGVNDSRSVPRRPAQTPPLSERIARSCLVSQVMRATRAKGPFKVGNPPCQEVPAKSCQVVFLGLCDN